MRDRVLSRFTNSQTQLIDYQKALTAFKLIYRMRAGGAKNQIIKSKRTDEQNDDTVIFGNNFISVQDQDKPTTPLLNDGDN